MNVSFIDLYAPPERDAPVSTQKDRPVMYGSIVITLNCSYEVLILESKSYDGDDVGGSVVTYIVALEHLLQEMDKASHIWAKIKSSALLNTREVLCQMTNISKHEECREVKEGQISFQIDVLVDKSRRNLQIQEEVDLLENTKVVYILMDVVKTLARLNFPLCGDLPNESMGNFNQILNLLSRHCLTMEHGQKTETGEPILFPMCQVNSRTR
ncbi:unnamed protein product [Lepeophtheirus salmonis]|uniref:(salmon louse) hypothetical protein n=1 Tax=Lepeophtheirus salmonis TaxID=72036 RepID=A0A7R8CWE7_LEPSM|nr:unnamed protein product [Lepeophtheirus salmonis]CAF2920156.1 unnamed protein product [Lepeophtheirus salmonis]